MSKLVRRFCDFRYYLSLILCFGVMVSASQPIFAQPKGQNRMAREFQPVLRTYPITRASAAEAERVLSEVFRGRSITVSHNAAQNSALVWATDAEHVQIEHFLKQQQVLGMRQPAQPGAINLATMVRLRQAARNANTFGQTRFASTQYHDTGSNVPAVWQNPNGMPQGQVQQVAGYTQTQAPPLITSSQTTQRFSLKKESASGFEAKILNALQNRTQPLRSVSGNQTLYTIPLRNNQQVEMTIDRQSNIVSFTGPGAQVETFMQIAQLLDSEPSEVVTGIVPVTRGNEQPIRDFARLVNQPSNQFAASQSQAGRNGQSGSELRFATPSNLTNGVQPPLPPDVGGLVGPIEVTILDGMVVINARTPGDLTLAREIINYIEAMSREYEPTILEVPMVHADCTRVATVASQLYSEWFADQRGRISITPLVRPNSILLIGYPGSIQSVQDLIAKLDTPIDAQAQVQVFPLKHASSETVKTTLDNIYTARTTATTQQGAGATGTASIGSGLASTVSVASDQRTNSVIVQAAPRDLLEIAAIILKLDKANNEVNMVIKIIPLRNTMASNLATLLQDALTGQTTGMGGLANQLMNAPQSGVSFTAIDAGRGERLLNAGIFSGVTVVADTNGNNLVVKAPPECMPLIEAVVQSLDGTPLAVAQIKVFTIINSDASTLLTTLNDIFQTTQTGGGAAGSTVSNYRLGDSAENSAIVPVRFSSDTRTNSIVAVGSADMLAMVEAILLTLDEPEMHNRRLMVYRLLNTPASTIAQTLTTFLQNERQLRQQSNVLIGEADIFTTEVIITAETETNSLLVSTTPAQFDRLRRMIQVLDEAPAMVQIKVVIAEVDISNTDELGFELGLQDSLLFNRGILNSGDYQTRTVTTNVPGVGQVQTQEIISESRQPGFNFNNTTQGLGNNKSDNSQYVGTQGISNFALGRQNSELGYGGFVFSASSESVSVLIRALEESRKLTVLNNPTLYALHNQQSILSVGQLVPTITSVDIDDNGRQTNQIEEKEVGIRLQLTPRIALDNSVTMNIEANKSSMDSDSNGTPIFVQDGVTVRSAKTNSAAITTTIRTENGQVAVLGGLNSQEEQMTHRAVPVVSRIPLLGQLFQYNYKYCQRKELIFVFTPQVFRTREEADAVNQLAFARMHWCAQNVTNMLDTNAVKNRMSDFTSSETTIERGQAVLLDEKDIPSEKTIIENSTQQDRMLPQQPVKAPTVPQPRLY